MGKGGLCPAPLFPLLFSPRTPLFFTSITPFFRIAEKLLKIIQKTVAPFAMSRDGSSTIAAAALRAPAGGGPPLPTLPREEMVPLAPIRTPPHPQTPPPTAGEGAAGCGNGHYWLCSE